MDYKFKQGNNNCYLISAVQALLSIPEFRLFLLETSWIKDIKDLKDDEIENGTLIALNNLVKLNDKRYEQNSTSDKNTDLEKFATEKLRNVMNIHIPNRYVYNKADESYQFIEDLLNNIKNELKDNSISKIFLSKFLTKNNKICCITDEDNLTDIKNTLENDFVENIIFLKKPNDEKPLIEIKKIKEINKKYYELMSIVYFNHDRKHYWCALKNNFIWKVYNDFDKEQSNKDNTIIENIETYEDNRYANILVYRLID